MASGGPGSLLLCRPLYDKKKIIAQQEEADIGINGLFLAVWGGGGSSGNVPMAWNLHNVLTITF